jgi:hypothetical protein
MIKKHTRPKNKDVAKPLGTKDDAQIPIKVSPFPRIVQADQLSRPSPPANAVGTGPVANSREIPRVRLKLKDTIRVINAMLKAGVISRYAIGGAVGATFYIEAIRTVDVDVFVPIHQQPDSLIVTLDHFSKFLEQHNYQMKGEYWELEGNLVQFMPIEGDPLLQEAITQAREFDLEGISTFVFSPEYLAAIALKVSRPEKDVPRILQFIREKALDERLFLDILARHDMTSAWKKFQEKFLTE